MEENGSGTWVPGLFNIIKPANREYLQEFLYFLHEQGYRHGGIDGITEYLRAEQTWNKLPAKIVSLPHTSELLERDPNGNFLFKVRVERAIEHDFTRSFMFENEGGIANLKTANMYRQLETGTRILVFKKC